MTLKLFCAVGRAGATSLTSLFVMRLLWIPVLVEVFHVVRRSWMLVDRILIYVFGVDLRTNSDYFPLLD